MRIAVVGTGYVGLVTGTCLAESGNDVTCIDILPEKIARLTRGDIPIYEPGLEELVKGNVKAGRLSFTTDLAAAIKNARLVFLAVGTPPGPDGAADLSALWKAVDAMAPHLAKDAVVINKSTVPVGTCALMEYRLLAATGRKCDVASNPEFLKEGAAIDDFMYPDRVVVGVRRPEVGQLLQELYSPFLRTEKPFLVMSPESSEMTKYVANAMLATKISFINEMANLTERVGADINDVRKGIGHDSRIGFQFLFPGVGYGGSCFPKDVRALEAMAQSVGCPAHMLRAVEVVNDAQKMVIADKLTSHFGKLSGKTIAIWGLAFKPRTDDIRDAPSLTLIDWLLKQNARCQVFDPEAMENVRAIYGDKLRYAERMYDALDKADALVIVTEWKDFGQPDLERLKSLLKTPVVFDGRNMYSPSRMAASGFTYYSIGRAKTAP
jgi:UDPglucose 6-dehydrogenase